MFIHQTAVALQVASGHRLLGILFLGIKATLLGHAVEICLAEHPLESLCQLGGVLRSYQTTINTMFYHLWNATNLGAYYG